MLTKTPKNVVVEAGKNVTLECASNDSARPVIWLYESVIISRTSTCRSTDPRFVAKSVANGCFLTALGNYIISGPYTCHGPNNGKDAESVVIVMGTSCRSE